MAGTGIMAGIYSSPSASPYPIEKIGDSPYPYTYPVNAGISCQNGDGFGQYPRGRVCLPSLSAELPISFRKKFYNLLNNFFLLFIGIHFLCTTSLNISYKNQPLLLSLGGCLEEKN